MLQFLIALDQLLNTVFLGWADETLSSRAWRLSARSTNWARARRLIDAAFALLWQNDHCFEAWTSERLRAHFPVELRDAVGPA